MKIELPEFMSYGEKFTKKGFLEKIAKIAKRAGAKLVYAALILFYTLQSKEVPLKDKGMIVAALGFLISPIDAIPDAIPIVGLSDDLAVLLYVLDKVWVNVPEDVKEKARGKLTKWFDEIEMEEINEILDGKKPSAENAEGSEFTASSENSANPESQTSADNSGKVAEATV